MYPTAEEIEELISAPKWIESPAQWHETGHKNSFRAEARLPIMLSQGRFNLQIHIDVDINTPKLSGSVVFFYSRAGYKQIPISRMEMLNSNAHTNSQYQGLKNTDLTLITVPPDCYRIYSWDDNKHLYPEILQDKNNLAYCRELPGIDNFLDSINHFFGIINVEGCGLVREPPHELGMKLI